MPELSADKPLAGIRVVEIGTSVAVPTAQASGKSPERQGTTARGMAPYQAYECSDGFLIIAAPNDRLFERLSGVLGHPEWPGDPRFETNQLRWEHLAELNDLMGLILRSEKRETWRGKLDEAGVPTAPVMRRSQ